MIKINKTYDNYPDCLDFPKVESYLEKFVDSNTKLSWSIVEYEKIEDELNDLYNCKCAYCESKLDKIELIHYRPVKGKETNKMYKSLAFEWSNILPVCPKCKDLKGDKFPLIKYCDAYDIFLCKNDRNPLNCNSLLNNEIPKIINPEFENPDEYFEYDDKGRITPKEKNKRAKETIEIFDLNRFIPKRQAISNKLFNTINALLDDYIYGEITKQKYIKDLSKIFKEIIDNSEKDKEYSAYYKFIINNFKNLIHKHISCIESQTEIITAFNNYRNGKPFTSYFKSINYIEKNHLSSDGIGNILLQDINGSTITINYTETDKFEKIAQSFRESQHVEHQYIAALLEKFHLKLSDLNVTDLTKDQINKNLLTEVGNYNSDIKIQLSELNKLMTCGFEDIKKLLRTLISDHSKFGDTINNHEQKILNGLTTMKTEILEGQQIIKDEIIKAITELTEAQTEAIWADISEIFQLFETSMDEKLLEQIQQIKSTSSLKSKLELSIPFIKMLGVDYKTEFDVVGWAKKMYEKHKLKIFKFMGMV